MCIEWVRKNPGAALSVQQPSPPTEVKKEPSLRVLPDRPGPAKAREEPNEPSRAPTKAGSKDAYVLPKASRGPNLLVSHPELISEAAITELEVLGYEVELTMSDGRNVFLVPAYTRTGRTELTFQDARTLLLLLQVFPGTRLVKINSKSALKVAGEGERS